MSNLNVNISADISNFRKALIDAQNRLKALTDQQKQQMGVTDESVTAFNRSAKAMNTATNGSKTAEQAMKILSKEIKELRLQYNQLSEGAKNSDFGRLMSQQINQAESRLRSLRSELNQLNRTGSVNVDSKGLSAFNTILSEINPKLGQLGSALSASTSGTETFTAALGGNAAAIGIAVAAVGTAIAAYSELASKAVEVAKEYDKAQTSLVKYSGATKSEVKSMTEEFKKMNTSTSTTELLDLASTGAKLGVAKDQLVDFSKALNEVKMAMGEDIGDAGLSDLSKIAGTSGLAVKEGWGDAISAIGSGVNELAQTTAASEKEIIDFNSRLSVLVNTGKLTEGQLLGLGATFSAAGMSSEQASTAINTLVTSMGSKLSGFAEVAGMSVKDFTSLYNNDMMGALNAVSAAFNSMPYDEQAKRMSELSISGAGVANALQLMGANSKLLSDNINIANNQLQSHASIQSEVAAVMNSVEGQQAAQKKQFEDTVSVLGEQLMPVVIQCTEWFNEFVKEIVNVSDAIINFSNNTGLTDYLKLVGNAIMTVIEVCTELVSIIVNAAASVAGLDEGVKVISKTFEAVTKVMSLVVTVLRSFSSMLSKAAKDEKSVSEQTKTTIDNIEAFIKVIENITSYLNNLHFDNFIDWISKVGAVFDVNKRKAIEFKQAIDDVKRSNNKYDRGISGYISKMQGKAVNDTSADTLHSYQSKRQSELVAYVKKSIDNLKVNDYKSAKEISDAVNNALKLLPSSVNKAALIAQGNRAQAYYNKWKPKDKSTVSSTTAAGTNSIPRRLDGVTKAADTNKKHVVDNKNVEISNDTLLKILDVAKGQYNVVKKQNLELAWKRMIQGNSDFEPVLKALYGDNLEQYFKDYQNAIEAEKTSLVNAISNSTDMSIVNSKLDALNKDEIKVKGISDLISLYNKAVSEQNKNGKISEATEANIKETLSKTGNFDDSALKEISEKLKTSLQHTNDASDSVYEEMQRFASNIEDDETRLKLQNLLLKGNNLSLKGGFTLLDMQNKGYVGVDEQSAYINEINKQGKDTFNSIITSVLTSKEISDKGKEQFKRLVENTIKVDYGYSVKSAVEGDPTETSKEAYNKLISLLPKKIENGTELVDYEKIGELIFKYNKDIKSLTPSESSLIEPILSAMKEIHFKPKFASVTDGSNYLYGQMATSGLLALKQVEYSDIISKAEGAISETNKAIHSTLFNSGTNLTTSITSFASNIDSISSKWKKAKWYDKINAAVNLLTSTVNTITQAVESVEKIQSLVKTSKQLHKAKNTTDEKATNAALNLIREKNKNAVDTIKPTDNTTTYKNPYLSNPGGSDNSKGSNMIWYNKNQPISQPTALNQNDPFPLPIDNSTTQVGDEISTSIDSLDNTISLLTSKIEGIGIKPTEDLKLGAGSISVQSNLNQAPIDNNNGQNMSTSDTMSGIGGTMSAAGNAMKQYANLQVASAKNSEEAAKKQQAASKVSQVAGITMALAGAFTAVGELTKSAAETPGGVFTKIAASIAAVAAGATIVAGILSLTKKHAQGGLTEGSNGASFGGMFSGGGHVGDYNLARVNSGEMILNGTQQSRLFSMLNSSPSMAASSNGVGQVQFVIEGDKLVGAINNYNKIRNY